MDNLGSLASTAFTAIIIFVLAIGVLIGLIIGGYVKITSVTISIVAILIATKIFINLFRKD